MRRKLPRQHGNDHQAPLGCGSFAGAGIASFASPRAISTRRSSPGNTASARSSQSWCRTALPRVSARRPTAGPGDRREKGALLFGECPVPQRVSIQPGTADRRLQRTGQGDIPGWPNRQSLHRQLDRVGRDHGPGNDLLYAVRSLHRHPGKQLSIRCPQAGQALSRSGSNVPKHFFEWLAGKAHRTGAAFTITP